MLALLPETGYQVEVMVFGGQVRWTLRKRLSVRFEANTYFMGQETRGAPWSSRTQTACSESLRLTILTNSTPGESFLIPDVRR